MYLNIHVHVFIWYYIYIVVVYQHMYIYIYRYHHISLSMSLSLLDSIYTRIYAQMCVSLYIYIYMHREREKERDVVNNLSIRKHVSKDISKVSVNHWYIWYVYMCMYIHLFYDAWKIFVYTSACICTHIYTYVYMYVCMYAYTSDI